MFDVVFILIKQESPAYESTITMTRYFYDLGFTLGDKGYVSAVAVILFLIIITVTIIQFSIFQKNLYQVLQYLQVKNKRKELTIFSKLFSLLYNYKKYVFFAY